jgi:hypothetical protein
LDDAVFQKIESLVKGRFEPEARIGALEGRSLIVPMPKPFVRDKSGRKSDDSDGDYQARADGEKQRIDGVRRGILKEQITALKGAVEDRFDPSRVPATQRDFRAIQFIAAGIDLLEQLQGLSKNNTQAGELFDCLSGPGRPLGETEQLGTIRELRSGVFFRECFKADR